jgi:carboxyl-terminal processing protease
MHAIRIALTMAAAFGVCANAGDNRYAEAAEQLDATVAENYAYLDELPNGELPKSDVLTAERKAVHDDRTLLAYAEKRLASLADHHAITGSSFRDSWAVVPTYTDLWVVKEEDRFVVDAVRDGSPAEDFGVAVGDTIIAVSELPIDQAISLFWTSFGLPETQARAEYAARVLVAGRRDRARRIKIKNSSGTVHELVLPSMYDLDQGERPPLTVCRSDSQTVVRFNNSLGDSGTIDAFDNAMRAVPESDDLVIDLRDTPSGGNTTVARAIMGWFVTEPRGYQIHNRPAEQRQTGIPRQWIEQVLPREGKYRAELPIIVVGRWTGSMGEGIAVGFASLGAEIRGTKMAGLKGSIEDLWVGETDLSVKLPTEKLLTTSGYPRDDFVPEPMPDKQLILGAC